MLLVRPDSKVVLKITFPLHWSCACTCLRYINNFLKQHLISQKHCYIAKLHRIWLWGISHFSVMRKIIFNAIKNFSNITRFAKSMHSFIFVFKRFCAKKQGPKIDWLNHELEICFIKKYIFLNLVQRKVIQ